MNPKWLDYIDTARNMIWQAGDAGPPALQRYTPTRFGTLPQSQLSQPQYNYPQVEQPSLPGPPTTDASSLPHLGLDSLIPGNQRGFRLPPDIVQKMGGEQSVYNALKQMRGTL